MCSGAVNSSFKYKVYSSKQESATQLPVTGTYYVWQPLSIDFGFMSVGELAQCYAYIIYIINYSIFFFMT